MTSADLVIPSRSFLPSYQLLAALKNPSDAGPSHQQQPPPQQSQPPPLPTGPRFGPGANAGYPPPPMNPYANPHAPPPPPPNAGWNAPPPAAALLPGMAPPAISLSASPHQQQAAADFRQLFWLYCNKTLTSSNRRMQATHQPRRPKLDRIPRQCSIF